MVDEEKNKKHNPPPSQEAFEGIQLSLFQDVLGNGVQEKDGLSHTMELWDAVPKYYYTRRQQAKIRKDGLLPTAIRDFVFRGESLTVKIRPALITVDGKDKAFYPSAREELVEDALRKLACKRGNGYLDGNNNRSGVSFSLHELRKELKKRGHSLSYYQVTESLDILSSTVIEIAPLNGKALYKTLPLTTLAAVSKEDFKTDPGSRWYVDFSLLITENIKLIKYRQYNYGLMMGHKSQLARYLHKRMAHIYSQASLMHPYMITLNGIARDSGLLNWERPSANRQRMEKCLDELVKNDVLLSYDRIEICGPKNKIEDIKYSLFPSQDFVKNVKRANKRISLNR